MINYEAIKYLTLDQLERFLNVDGAVSGVDRWVDSCYD